MKRLGILLALATPAFAQTAATIPSMPVSTFNHFVGANVHLEYSDGLYADYNQVIADLKYLGITRARDSYPVPIFWSSIGIPDMEAVMTAGIKFDLISSTQYPSCGNPPAAMASCSTPIDTAQIDALLNLNPAGVASVEGLNEINNQGGVTLPEAEAMQSALYAATKADPKLGPTIPVLDFTGLNDVAGTEPGVFDAANIHPYPTGGTEPDATFKQNLAELYTGPIAAKYITEFGYTSLPDGASGVNEFAQADMELNGIMDAAADGYSGIYLYELLDAYADNYYGLFNFEDGGPKLVATYLHNLNAVLPVDKVSTPVSVSAIQVGLPATARQVAFTAANGDVYLWTWDEPQSWDVATQTYTMEALTPFYEQVEGKFSSVTEFAPGFTGIEDVIPVAPAGTFNGLPFYPGLYTNTPVCLHFRK
jgi:hypothetical protein